MLVPLGTKEPMGRRHFPFVTLAIVAVNILVFLYELGLLLNGGQDALNAFINNYGVTPAAITGQTKAGVGNITLLTSMFIHGGLSHIGFNMLFLMVFGDNVEDRLGRLRYLVFYLVAGLIASAAQIAVDPTSTVPSIGASGAIAGVLGAYLLLFPRGSVRMFIFLGIIITITYAPALLFIAFWFVSQFFSGVAALGVQTAETGGVAYWAHVGGFASGLVMAVLVRRFSPRPLMI